ncbi:uncharacterized protein A1O9_12010 [Exophiala aquamarina CBS 119918]|uniref:Uncharacterized protein n=1 Tax=Exophiala aquamarina CBS 119918 TaxID=1182545 RepID=A0A072P8V2_9EURO|nr:uncharacterized protein A1O9_12010 [Exophiala aquamarina CBS 119918]KEF52020.1 hypothetical protein A1O9_12010 [Exophiala aquamarina CBS 119918]
MTTMGKHFGGNLAFGAFGGRKEIMQQYELSQRVPLFHSGTWNNNRFTVAAGFVGTSLLTRKAPNKANSLGDKPRDVVNTIFDPKALRLASLEVLAVLWVLLLQSGCRCRTRVIFLSHGEEEDLQTTLGLEDS